MVDTEGLAKSVGELMSWIYNLLHSILDSLRTKINNDLILLGIAIVLAYYLNKKKEEGAISTTYIMIILSILIFLILKYI